MTFEYTSQTNEEKEMYDEIIKSFAKQALNNPSFFLLSREDQFAMAKEYLKKEKEKKEQLIYSTKQKSV